MDCSLRKRKHGVNDPLGPESSYILVNKLSTKVMGDEKFWLWRRLTTKMLTIFYLPNPSAQAGYDTRSISKRSFNKFEFRVFLPLD